MLMGVVRRNREEVKGRVAKLTLIYTFAKSLPR